MQSKDQISYNGERIQRLKYFYKSRPNVEGLIIEGQKCASSSSACENVSERGEQCHEGLGFEIEFP